MTTPSVSLVNIFARDSSLRVQWGLSNITGSVIEQTIYAFDTVSNQFFTADASTSAASSVTGFYLQRINNLINGRRYVVSVGIIVENLVGSDIVETEYMSNSLIGIPEGVPGIIPTITSVSGSEKPGLENDGKFDVRVFYNFSNDLGLNINNLSITKISFRLISDKTDEISLVNVLPSELQRDAQNLILENQYVDLLDTSDGVYDVLCAISNSSGTSPYSNVVSFELFDKPNKPILNAYSGLDSSVLLTISAGESLVPAFAINNIKVSYYKETEPENVTTLNVPPVSSGGQVNVSFTVPSLPTNGVKYFFRALAVNIRGEGIVSDEVFAYPGLPSKIKNLSLNYVSKTNLDATWEIDAKAFPITDLQYVVKDRISIGTILLSGSLPVDATSLNLSSLALPEGTEVSVILTSTNAVPAGFTPTVGTVTSNVWFIQANVISSAEIIVRARANMIFATSNLSSSSVTLVAKARQSLSGTFPQSQLTAISFMARSKLDPQGPFNEIGVVNAANFTQVSAGYNIYDGLAKITLSSIVAGSYDIRARCVYGSIYGPEDGVVSKAISVKLPKAMNLTVLELKKESFKFQLVQDVSGNFTSLTLELSNRAGAVVISKRLNYSSNDIYEAVFPESPLADGAVVLAKVVLENAVDPAFYNVYNDPQAPLSSDIVNGIVKYSSFALADELLVAFKGDVVTESGSDASMPFKITYPVSDWDLVSQVILQVAKVGEAWSTAQTLEASSATVVNGLKTLTGTVTGLNNGSSYKSRTHLVPKNIANSFVPYSSDSFYSALAVPFKRVEVSSATVVPEIDENQADCKLKVSANWGVSVGTFAPVYDVALLVDNVQVGSVSNNSGTSTNFDLLATAVATSLNISFVNSVDAARNLYNKQVKVSIVPKLLNSVISSDYSSLVLPSAVYTASSEYTTYSGLLSSNVLPKTVPAAPSGLALVSANPVKTTVKWNRATETAYNVAVDFILTISTTSTFDVETSTEYVVSRASIVEHRLDIYNLLAETTYYVKVVARNLLGKGMESQVTTFSTLIAVPVMGPITVSQSTADNNSNVTVNFDKFGVVNGYTIVRYELEVFNLVDGIKTKIGETNNLPEDVVVPIIYAGTFGQTYSFKVGALFTNIYGENVQIDPSESQNILVIDLPVINSVSWETMENGNSKAVIEILPNGSPEANIILVAFPNDSALSVVPVTMSQPTSVNGGVFVYEAVLSYYVGSVQKFMLVANNSKGNRYLLGGI